jgi:DNA-nicking Smr family endonuclease|tara:strand:+ start:150 stop:569 length:420 start_codon:yes stop_codon:yes gene_type:complete
VKKDKKISQQDIDTWQNYIKNPTDVTDKDKTLKKTDLNNFRYKYDLHGHSLIEANEKVKEIILSCVKRSFKEILLITGKGIHSNTDNDIYVAKDLSKLRYSVPEYIQSEHEILKHIQSVTNAEKKDGGEGAILIKLKKL